MNDRQRQHAVYAFQRPDRIPLTPGSGRRSTRDRWYAEGLPRDVADIPQFAYREVGGTLPWPPGGEGFKVFERMVPYFEQKVIERRERSLVVQDWKGNVCEISDEYDVSYLLNAIDFVTRRWIKCPVESREDWEAMKRRYDAADPSRYPDDPAAVGARLREREHYFVIGFSGPFWQLREWCGFEGLCTLMADEPEFVEEMVEFWQEHVLGLMRHAFQYVLPDEVHLSEDMAYKSFSMISPAMVRRFLMPCWKRWGECIRAAGVPHYGMDSDGFIGQLIPLWIEAGMDVCDPIEVAAGNDLVAFRREFGQRMAYRGGVDKRCIARGGKDIEDEMRRLAPVIEDGGFIPGCDHGVPHDVSWDHYKHYVRLLAQHTGWL